ncbi:MAG: DUF167 domain-containing protein [Gammaproteobacteria bacterium]|nr:DUF167 domain-containing protein [Gammaproteobacteria bacterium]
MKSELKFKIYLQPGAKKSEILGRHGDCIKIKVQSPPVDGKANEALINFLAKVLSISKSSITIKSGQKSRFKTICICNFENKHRIEQLLNVEK